MFFHVTKKENLNSILEEGLIPQIGDNSSCCETEPFVFLFTDEDSMNIALSSWFGELFDEDEELVSLKVLLPDDWELESDVEYEVASRKTIPPEFIEYYKDEWLFRPLCKKKTEEFFFAKKMLQFSKKHVIIIQCFFERRYKKYERKINNIRKNIII